MHPRFERFARSFHGSSHNHASSDDYFGNKRAPADKGEESDGRAHNHAGFDDYLGDKSVPADQGEEGGERAHNHAGSDDNLHDSETRAPTITFTMAEPLTIENVTALGLGFHGRIVKRRLKGPDTLSDTDSDSISYDPRDHIDEPQDNRFGYVDENDCDVRSETEKEKEEHENAEHQKEPGRGIV